MSAALLFRAGPYAAVAMAGLGFGARLWQLRHRPDRPRTSRQDRERAQDQDRNQDRSQGRNSDGWRLRPAQRLAALALVLLLAGHLVAILAPRPLLRLIARPGALYLLEGSGFLLGLLAVLAILPSLFRYLASAGESLAGEIGDGVFLSSVLISLACGLLVAARHRWALAWSLGTVVPYVHSVLAGRPATALVSGTPFAMQLHVVAALAALAVLPFSRLGAALALVILHVMEAGGAAIETAARVLVRWARPQQLAAWLWPAEDLLDLARHQRRQTAAARRVLRARDARAGQAAAPPVVTLPEANLNSGEANVPSVPVEGGQ